MRSTPPRRYRGWLSKRSVLLEFTSKPGKYPLGETFQGFGDNLYLRSSAHRNCDELSSISNERQ